MVERLTNAEAIIQALKHISDYDWAIPVVSYISCPYTHNPNCKYDGGNDSSCCDDCKIEWLQKDWEEEE